MKCPMPTSLRILWLTDTRPGHRNKALGLLHALEQTHPLEVFEHPVRWRIPAVRHLLGRLGKIGLSLPVSLFLKNAPQAKGYDIILSSGGLTQWPNAALARRIGVPNIFLGSVRRMDKGAFHLLPALDPPSYEAPYLDLDLIPSHVNPTAVATASQTWLPESKFPAWTVLIGGDGEGYRWSVSDLKSLGHALTAAAERESRKLYVATSPEDIPARRASTPRDFNANGQGRGCGLVPLSRSISPSVNRVYGRLGESFRHR